LSCRNRSGVIDRSVDGAVDEVAHRGAYNRL
jgi:hypothetical protein